MVLLRSAPPRELIDVMRRHHLNLRRDDPFDLPSRYAELYLLTIGHGRRATWVASGPHVAGQLAVFQYVHKLGASQRWARVVWTVCVLESATPRPGALFGSVMEPLAAGPFARYRRLSLRDQVAAESPCEASCESIETCRAWLDGGLLEFLARQDPRFTWELRAQLVAAYRPGYTDPAQLERLLEAVVALDQLTAAGGRPPVSSSPDGVGHTAGGPLPV